MTEMAEHGTEFAARTPHQLAEELSRVDSVKLNFGGEVYALTRDEIGWIVLALRGISATYRQS